MNKGKLIIAIGPPRSGKSTICNDWINYKIDIANNSTYNRKGLTKIFSESPRVIVCSDDIRLALTGERFNINTEGFIHAIQKVMIKSLLNRGFDVIVDGTNTLLEHIKELLYIDPNADYLIVDTPPEVCKERAIATNQSDLLPVIDRMSKQLNSWKNCSKNAIDILRGQVIRNNKTEI
jgi:predicted kinase